MLYKIFIDFVRNYGILYKLGLDCNICLAVRAVNENEAFIRNGHCSKMIRIIF